MVPYHHVNQNLKSLLSASETLSASPSLVEDTDDKQMRDFSPLIVLWICA